MFITIQISCLLIAVIVKKPNFPTIVQAKKRKSFYSSKQNRAKCEILTRISSDGMMETLSCASLCF